ncbi:hypothetical protein Y032_0484g2315 [Ancylostoma ceylanicum]|uniref:Bardet-Biedl syndrome 2 protein homolog n=2 Tax=Ancylostoma ceylanicum TaxID=53326 RepID=A0A016WVR7_9BILA|nr:hypothetical protein Y032_0484g2315 [Ancylostoma ceylanicum]
MRSFAVEVNVHLLKQQKMTEEAEEEVLGNDSFELASLFSFSLNHRILPRCATSARIEPDSRETLVAVSASNKVILRNNESSLHIPDKIKCITTVPFGMGYDYIVVGTESQVLVYDFHQNSTVFRRDVPDGVHCFAVGKLGELDRMILCGGNCAIWGFDETGKDVYWTVTGDAVTTMCFCDFDGDGEMELIIGSPDSELRIFKNDLMRAELLETDAVIVLQGFDRNRFGYALANGTVGMYHQDQRLWRIKSKSVITAILPYPNNDMITCAWNSGKIDVRSINENGEVVCRDSTLSGQTVIAGFISMMNNDDELEFTVVTAEGKVHGYNNSRPKELVDKTQETLHLFGQKKHNLLIELSNFEQEEQLSESEKEKDFRIPIGTSVECKLFVSKSDRNLYLVLEASHEVCIRGVIAFAEGLFEGESYIWIPKLIEGNGDRVQIPIITEKDMANEIHIRTFLGPQESNKLSVFETALSIPRFARFCVLQTEDAFSAPKSYVEVSIKIRNQRILDWVMDTFLIDIDYPIDPEEDLMEIRFLGLASKRDQELCIKHFQSDGKTIIYHECMETAGNIIQSLCDYFVIDTLEAHAEFPDKFAEVEEICNELDSMYDVRDRLTTDLTEKQTLLMEVVVRAEDAIVIDDM